MGKKDFPERPGATAGAATAAASWPVPTPSGSRTSACVPLCRRAVPSALWPSGRSVRSCPPEHRSPFGKIRSLAQLIAPGGGIGVVGGLGDRPRPARGGLLGDGPLALRPHLLTAVQPSPAALGQIRSGEPPQIGSLRNNHGFVGVRDTQPGADPQGGDRRRLHMRPDRVANPAAHALTCATARLRAARPTSILARLAPWGLGRRSLQGWPPTPRPTSTATIWPEDFASTGDGAGRSRDAGAIRSSTPGAFRLH